MATEKLWVRKASGLSRGVSPFDAFALGVNWAGVGLIAVYMGLSYALFPQGNPYIAYVIGSILCVFTMMCYALLAIAIPRSGGEYVFISRITHPSLALAFNLLTVWGMCMWTGWDGWMMSYVGLPAFFGTIGTVTNNPALMNLVSYASGPLAPWYTLVIGTIIVIPFCTLMCVIPIRHFGNFQKICVILILLGSWVAAAVLLSTSRETFVSNYNSLVGPDAYQKVIESAKSLGADLSPGYSAYATFALLPMVQTGLGWTYMSTFLAGELKDVKKSNLLAVPLGIFIMMITTLVWYWGMEQATGKEFLVAANYLSTFHPEALSLAVPPFVYLFASMSILFLPLVVLMVLSLPLTILAAGSLDTIIGTRSMFAWSFDRLVPSVIARVSDDWHSPYIAVIIQIIFSEVFLILYTFTSYFAVISITGGTIAGAAVIAICCIIIPFRKKTKHIYETSALARWRIGKIPIVTIVGALGLVWVLITEVMMVIEPAYGANSPQSIGSIIAIIMVGFVSYWIIRYVRKKQGIDLDLIYGEVPPV
jgi:amino acid transporter